MTNYTFYTGNISRKINKKIEGYLEIIVKEVKKNVDEANLISIILIGGFARGEGSAWVEKENISLMNDFDIFIITKEPLSRDLKELSLACMRKCKIKSDFSFKKSTGTMQFYIDFRNMTLEELKKVPPFIKYYEIRNSGKVIYGKNVLESIPDYKLSDIPLEEGLRHMFNRLSLLAEYLVPAYESMDKEKKKTALFFIGKCYLSMAEALLLYSGDFVCSYKDRGDIFKKVLKKKFSELSKIIPDLDKKVLLYTKFKLKPQPKDLNLDFQDLWFQARDDSIKFISYYLNKIYKLDKSLPLENPKNLSREIKNLLQRRLLLKYLKFYLSARGIKINNKAIIKLINIIAQNYINFLFAKELFKNNGKIKFRALFSFTDPGVKFYSSLIFCLCAINKNKKVDLSLVHDGYKSINRFFPMQKFKYNNPFSNWKNLCEEYTLAFRAYQFLKI